MKRMLTILTICIYLLLGSRKASAQWQWAEHFGSSYAAYNERAKVISDGTNSYLIGSFGGVLYAPNDTIQSLGSNDMFISKIDQNGLRLWTKQLGGLNSSFMDWEDINGVFDSVNNCIYLSGQFFGIATFGAAGSLFSSGGVDIFLAKIDLNGNFIWAKRAGGNGEDQALVFVNSSGTIYLVSQTKDSATFDNFHLPAGGSIEKYDTNGNCLIAENKFTVPNAGYYNYIFMNFVGNNIILYGSFKSAVFQIDNVSLTNKGLFDYFVAVCDSDLNIKWLKHFGGPGNDTKGDISVDKLGNIYSLINFSDSIKIDSLNFTPNSSSDVLLLKISAEGRLAIVKVINSSGAIYSNSTAIDANNELYLTGFFDGVSNFGLTSIMAGLPFDYFIAKFDTSLICIGADSFTNGQPTSISLDNAGNIICSGGFQNQVTIGNNSISSYGSYDIFLAKHDAITGIPDPRRTTNNQLNIHANPNEGKCNITVPDEFAHEKNLVLSIYNSSGKLIQQKKLEMNEGKIKLSLEAEAKGLYNAVLSNGMKSYSGKIVFE